MSKPSRIGRLRSSCHVAPLSSVRNSPACGDVAGIANLRPGCEVDAISAAPSLSGPTGCHVLAAAPSSSNDVWPSSVTPDWARAVAVTWYVPAGPAGTVTRHQPVWSNVAVDVVTRRSGPVTVTAGAAARSGSAWMNTVPPAGVGAGGRGRVGHGVQLERQDGQQVRDGERRRTGHRGAQPDGQVGAAGRAGAAEREMHAHALAGRQACAV